MLYQRKIAGAELLSSQLELQLQGGRMGMVAAQAVGVVVAVVILWFQLSVTSLLPWSLAFLSLLGVQTFHLNRSLDRERYRNHQLALFIELAAFSTLTGLAWSLTVAWLHSSLTDEAFYLLVGVIVLVNVSTVAISCVTKGLYLFQLLSTLVPIAAYLGWHFDARPFNLMACALLTGLAAVMAVACHWMGRAFSNVIEASMEREAMTRDLAELSESLRLRNLQLQDARKQLADIATIDELTGLRNRRGANRVFETEISRAKRSGMSLALIMIDVDHFKLYNDNYGHPAGDGVLKRIAEVLLSVTARAGELAVRMGGEEFLLILPGSNPADAMGTAKVIQQRVATLAIPHKASPTSKVVTVSQGVVSCSPRIQTSVEDLIEAADKALYASKADGRNGITLASFKP